jgi:hypothetical protein
MKRLLPVLLLAAFLASCSPPLFDYSLSQTVSALKSMTRDNPSPITISSGYDSEGVGFAFYPRVAQNGTLYDIDYANGFVVSTSNFMVQVRGAVQASGDYQLYSGSSQSLANPDSHAPPYAAWPVKSAVTSSAYLFGMIFNSADPTQNAFSLFTGTPSSNMLMGNGDLMANRVGMTGAAVLGASFAPVPGGNDVSYWLVYTAAGLFQEMQLTLMPPSLASAVTNPNRTGSYALAFLPASNRIQYFYDINSAADPARAPNRSFASWYDAASGSWKCAAWWGTTGTGDWEMLPIDHRIDALLSTGELLSIEDGTGRLYSRDGALEASFPLGTLAFIGEEYIGSAAARVYFSQCLRYDNRLVFNVYWIPTSQLKGIGG